MRGASLDLPRDGKKSEVVVAVLIARREDEHTTCRNIQIREAACGLAVESCRERSAVGFEQIHTNRHRTRIGIGEDKLCRPTAACSELRQQDSTLTTDSWCNAGQ